MSEVNAPAASASLQLPRTIAAESVSPAPIRPTQRRSSSAGGPVCATAVWGPVMTTQIAGEHVLGGVTHGGRLRMTDATHAPVPRLLPDMRRALEAASSAPKAT